MKPKLWIPLSGALLLAMFAGAVWAFATRPAREVVEMRSLTKQMYDAENLSDDQRVQVAKRMREIKESISDNRREAVFAQMKADFRSATDQHFRKFAALADDQRDTFLDQDIERLRGMKNAWEKDRGRKRSATKDANPKRDRTTKKRPPKTEEQRQARRRRRLDNSSAEQRAYKEVYVNAMKQRLLERGIEYFKGRKVAQ